MSTSLPAELRVPENQCDNGNSAHTSDEPLGLDQDAQLMLRIRAGDHGALATLLDRYSGLVLEIGWQVLRDRGEAEELAQEVFLGIYRKCGSFDPEKGTVRGWLRRIAYRYAFDRKHYLNNRRF